MAKAKLNVIQNDGEEIAAEVIAQSIVDISHAMKVLNGTRLTRAAIVTLIHEKSKVARKTIEIVLNNLDSLEETWLKKKV